MEYFIQHLKRCDDRVTKVSSKPFYMTQNKNIVNLTMMRDIDFMLKVKKNKKFYFKILGIFKNNESANSRLIKIVNHLNANNNVVNHNIQNNIREICKLELEINNIENGRQTIFLEENMKLSMWVHSMEDDYYFLSNPIIEVDENYLNNLSM
jgi:hypothetical protein